MSVTGFWIASDECVAELDDIFDSLQGAIDGGEYDIGSPAALRHLATNVMSLIISLKHAQDQVRQ